MSRNSQRNQNRKSNKLIKTMIKQIIIQFLIWARIQFEWLTDFLSSLYWDPKKEILPPLDKNSKILLESASSLALKIRKKQLKSENLVKICIDRIKAVNPIINAVTDERYVAAVDEARAIDKQIENAAGDEFFKSKPFLGVPFTAKESYAVSGMLHTVGLLSRKSTRADTDAEAVKLMKEAGAILVAVSNVPEINKWQETRNMVFGQTCNPYHTGRTVGGSSGGEAALVSSVCSPIGLCSDIGGSTRMPAYYCGLFGHNPTTNLTNMRGATFRTGFEKDSMVCAGAVVKHSEDIIPILKVLTADNSKQLHLDVPIDIRKLKYYYVEKTGDKTCSGIRYETKNCMAKVIENLTETVAQDIPPQKVEFEGFQYMYKIWRYWMSKEPADFVHLMGNQKYRPNGVFELLKKLIGMSDFTFAGIIGLIDEQLLPKENEGWILSVYNKLKKDVIKLLGNDGVLIFYSTTQSAPYHYLPFLRFTNFGYWCIFNALRLPSTQVPLGLDSEGLPCGIQVVAGPYNDRLCIAVAKHLEEAFHGFVPPCNTIS